MRFLNPGTQELDNGSPCNQPWAPRYIAPLRPLAIPSPGGSSRLWMGIPSTYQQHKVRLAGIDAPERKQAYGNASRTHLASLVAAKQVRIDYQKYDRHGRVMGKVLVNGRDVCLEQVRAGYAWHYKHYQEEQTPSDRYAYAKAEW